MNTNIPLVSVVVPNHNYADWLPQCVKSLAGQTYARLELILIDDGSTDDSLDVIRAMERRFADRFERFHVIDSRHNRGKAAALNRAIPEARGHIILNVDSDDWLDPRFLDHTIDRLTHARRKNPKVGLVYTDCWLVAEDGRRLTLGHSRPFDAPALEHQSYIPTCAPGLTSMFMAALPFDEAIRAGCKHHMWKKIVAAGWEGVYLQEPLFYYRMHSQNLSGIGSKILPEIDQGLLDSRILSGYWPPTR